MTTTTDPCEDAAVPNGSCPMNSPSGAAYIIPTTTMPPPCTGNVTATIAVSNVQVVGTNIDVTVSVTIESGRSDTINDLGVSYDVYGGDGYGFEGGGIASPPAGPHGVSFWIAPGGSATFSGESTVPVGQGDPSAAATTAIIWDYSYGDTLSYGNAGYGCGAQTLPTTTTPSSDGGG